MNDYARADTDQPEESRSSVIIISFGDFETRLICCAMRLRDDERVD